MMTTTIEKDSKSVFLPTIYKRTSTGKTQEWTIEVNGNKYRTISGQVDGKKVTSKFTVCAGKNTGKANATTPETQALREAEAKRKLKLGSEYTETVDAIDDTGVREPLLAQNFKDYEEDIMISVLGAEKVFSQPKLDGIRCIGKPDGLRSRNDKKIVAARHIETALAPIFKDYPDVVFDGELYNHELKDNFDKIISLARKGKPSQEDLLESERYIQYWIYDIQDPTKTFEERDAFIQKCFIKYSSLRGVCTPVPTHEVKTREYLDALYESYRDDGYEGQMVRRNGVYEFKRSMFLFKRKEFIDKEFEILGVIEGKGNRSGGAGKLMFEIEGKPFEANIKGGTALYERILRNPNEVIGKMATVRYQNLTPKGIPRFPVCTVIRDYE